MRVFPEDIGCFRLLLRYYHDDKGQGFEESSRLSIVETFPPDIKDKVSIHLQIWPKDTLPDL